MLILSLPLHDSFLVGINIESNDLSLLFQVLEDKILFRLENLGGLCMNNFLSGNIILSASVCSLPLSQVEFDIVGNVASNYVQYYNDPRSLSSGRALIVESSYGAELIAIYGGKIIGPSGKEVV